MEFIKTNYYKLIQFIKDKKKLLICTLIILLIPIILLIITKITPSNRTLTKLNSIASDIEKTNISLGKTTLSKDFNTEVIKTELSSSIVTFKNLKDTLISIEVTEKNINGKDKLIELLDCNLSLCEQSLYFYNNPSSKSLSDKLKLYKKDLDSFKDILNYLNTLGITISLESSTEFFSRTYNYFQSLIQLNIINDITSEKISTFVLKVDDFITYLKEIDGDLKPALENIKENKRDINLLLDDVSKKVNSLNLIKDNLYMISIPEEGNLIYESLIEVVQLYEIYIKTLEETLINDSNNNFSLKDYDNAFSKYSDYKTFLDKLCNDLDIFKRN